MHKDNEVLEGIAETLNTLFEGQAIMYWMLTGINGHDEQTIWGIVYTLYNLFPDSDIAHVMDNHCIWCEKYTPKYWRRHDV